MKTAEPNGSAPAADTAKQVLRLPLGLLGFEQVKQFILTENPQEAPFGWLQVQDDPRLAFLVINPGTVFPWYQPDVAAADVAVLGLEKPEDAAIYIIVTLLPNRPPTANLKGPIVVNRQTSTAKQVIPVNAAEYAVQHPLPVAS
jgi:flagellar assembly factor FliW